MAAELKSIISVYGRMDSSFLALSKKISALGKTISGMGGAITAMTMPVIAAAKQSLETYTSFDDVMRDIQAVGQYGATEMEQVFDAALQAGRDTRFLASDAASAMLYLVQAGVELDETLDVLPALLDAASAGGMDLATTSDLLISNIYSLNRSFNRLDVSRYVDAAVTAADATNTTMEEIMEGVSKAGAVGDMLGDDMALLTWMGMLSNLNRKGTEAGIDMRNIIISLLAPTDKAGKLMESLAISEEEAAEALEDINLKSSAAAMEKLGVDVIDPTTGKMRSLVDIFGDFNAAMAGMDAAEAADLLYTIFGKRTLASAQGLMGMIGPFWDIYQQVLSSEGAAATKADIKEGGIGGTIRELSSAIENLELVAGKAMEGRVGEHMETLRGIILDFSEAIAEVEKTNPQAISDAVDIFLGLAAAGPTLIIAGKGLQMIGDAVALMSLPGGSLVATSLGLFGILAGIKGIADAAADYESIEAFFNTAGEAGAKFVDNIADGIQNGIDNTAKITGAIGSLFTQINEEEWGTHIGTAGADILGAILADMEEIAANPNTAQVLGNIGQIIGEGIEFTGDFASEIVAYVLSPEGLSAITSAGIEIGGALGKGIIMAMANIGTGIYDMMLGIIESSFEAVMSWFGIETDDTWSKLTEAPFQNEKGEVMTGGQLRADYLTDGRGTVADQAAAFMALQPFVGEGLDMYEHMFSAAGVALSQALIGGMIQGEENQIQAAAALMAHGMEDGLEQYFTGRQWYEVMDAESWFDEAPDLGELYEQLGLGTVPQTIEEALGNKAWSPVLKEGETASEQIQKLAEETSASMDATLKQVKENLNAEYDAYRDELGVQTEELPQVAASPPEEVWQYALRMATGGQPAVTVTTGPDAAQAGAEYGAQLQSGIDGSSPTANVNVGYDPAAVDAVMAAAQAQVASTPLTATVNIRTSGGIGGLGGSTNNTSSYGTLARVLQKFAEGGRATQASIFGEAGPEWAIPEEHTQRTAELLSSAARASGFTMKELMARTGGMNASATAQFVFSPTIYANDVRGVEDALARGKEEMEEWFDRRMRDEERMSYA